MPLRRKKQVRRMPFGPNAGMPHRGLAGAMQMPQPKLLPRRQPREKAVKEIGQKPVWARTGWASVPVIGGLFDLIRNIVFPKERFRTSKRAFIGTGLGKPARERLLQVRMSSLRKGPLTRAEQTQALKNRTPGLKQSIATQHRRGRIRGVPKYPKERAA